jgi:adenylosuccinate lyase
MYHSRTMDTVNTRGALSVAAIYTWLLLNKTKIPSTALWYVAPAVLLFCAMQYLDMNQRISNLAVYLVRIEENAFGNDPLLPGWERYKVSKKLRRYDKLHATLASTAWLIVIIASIYLSWHLS